MLAYRWNFFLKGVLSNRKKEGEPTKVKGGEYIVESTAYASPSILTKKLRPFAMSLPMGCPPNKWKVVPHRQKARRDSNVPLRVSDLVGGYFTPEAAELSQRYRLLTSKFFNHFYAVFYNVECYKQLC